MAWIPQGLKAADLGSQLPHSGFSYWDIVSLVATSGSYKGLFQEQDPGHVLTGIAWQGLLGAAIVNVVGNHMRLWIRCGKRQGHFL